jgi:uncharacterized membrane protein
MLEAAFLWEWAEFAARWLHVITGIAWIGSSFYFIALDLGLRKAHAMPRGVLGEEWQVHGGGFYHIQKYTIAPDHMPDHLTWFKWEAYATWLSGAALMAIVYWVGAELFLIDPGKADLPVWLAILISGGSLAIGWLIYDALCKSPLGDRPTALMLVLFALLTAMAWGYDQSFTGRAALLHLGAFTGTIMVANVFLIIIPNQKIVVADLRAGRTPDAKYGRIAKLRSMHNNYLTLPVLFLMLSIHYPLAFATQYNWLIASLTFLMGVTIRHWFNTRHAGKGSPWWTWPATAAVFAAIMALSLAPAFGPFDMAADREPTPREARFADADGFDAAYGIVMGRCAMCHAREPNWPGTAIAPNGVLLETEADVARQAREIYLQAGRSHAMPPAAVAFVPADERAVLAAWYRAGAAAE